MSTPNVFNTWKWMVRREVWEHRGSVVYLPLAILGVLIVLAALVVGINDPNIHTWPPAMSRHIGSAAQSLVLGVWGLLGGTMTLAMVAYSAHCLHDERRDRSILFWKSLPVSDTMAVAAKASVPLVLAPLIVWVCGLVGGVVLSGLGWLGLITWGAPVSGSLAMNSLQQLMQEGFGSTTLLVWPVFALSALPSVGWLMACSAWARSKPLLWSVAGPLVAWVVWNSLRGMGLPLPALDAVLAHLWFGWWTLPGHGDLSMRLASPDLWWGAILGLGLLALAVWGRRRMT